MPDEYRFRSVYDDSVLADLTLPDLGLRTMRGHMEELTVPNALYSLGVAHPGAITLHNYPRFLQHFERASGEVMDLAAIDVLRIRERGVPRYNDFRRLFRLRPAASFEDLTPNSEWAAELRAVYDGDIENVDLMVGLYAEAPPRGFAFSDTAFRVFIVMAVRRLKSDRFLTINYTPETYTPEGFDWIDRRHVERATSSLSGAPAGAARCEKRVHTLESHKLKGIRNEARGEMKAQGRQAERCREVRPVRRTKSG